MSNRVLIFGDGGKAKELARIIASNRDTQVIMPIEQHDEEIRADERRKFVEWLSNRDYLGKEDNNPQSFTEHYWQKLSADEVLDEYEKEMKTK